jgi:tetratricopeptide (TPR) repeat protein
MLLALLLGAACGRPSAPHPAPGALAQASAPPPSGRGQLAQVRPPAAPCARRGAPRVLLEQADHELDRGEPARALACAEEALRAAPRLVAALRLRAEALSELARLDEARLTLSRALAIDPDDTATLRAGAELYVARLPSDRATLELGLEYALRGARLAERAPRPDRELSGALYLLAAMAENDLGASREALAHADRAIAARREDIDAQYERGVALYELCRFDEARQALERVRAKQPDDAWTLHYLALVAERTGHDHHAEELERRARTLAPEDFGGGVAIDRADFEAEVRRAVAALPEAERRALATVPLEVTDVPALDDLTAVDPPLSPSILGLFRGPSEGEACLPEDGPRCRSVVLYRLNLARFARDRADLSEQVRVTLLHELGHLHGESDDELRARGLE